MWFKDVRCEGVMKQTLAVVAVRGICLPPHGSQCSSCGWSRVRVTPDGNRLVVGGLV